MFPGGCSRCRPLGRLNQTMEPARLGTRANEHMTKTATSNLAHPRRAAPERAGSSGAGGPDGAESPGPRRPLWLLGSVVLLAILIVVLLIANANRGGGLFGFAAGGSAGEPGQSSVPIPARYDADRAFAILVELCDIGPRPSGSAGMAKQQAMLSELFERNGGRVTLQSFEIRHPEDGSAVPMANLIASWHPDRPKRFLVCAHYDTRPYPDRDRRAPQGVFVGANDGASGTAALAELSYHLADLPPDVGVDLVLFDAEEFIWEEGRDEYFLGSKFFAEKYKAAPPPVAYRAGILLDMIGDRELKIYYERNSMRYARDVAVSIWRTAARLGVTAFVPRTRHEIQDDHLPLNQIAGIPTVDLIDFDYPRPGIGAPSYWHTEDDVPANCSGESLVAVVWVVHEWLKQQ